MDLISRRGLLNFAWVVWLEIEKEIERVKMLKLFIFTFRISKAHSKVSGFLSFRIPVFLPVITDAHPHSNFAAHKWRKLLCLLISFFFWECSGDCSNVCGKLLNQWRHRRSLFSHSLRLACAEHSKKVFSLTEKKILFLSVKLTLTTAESESACLNKWKITRDWGKLILWMIFLRRSDSCWRHYGKRNSFSILPCSHQMNSPVVSSECGWWKKCKLWELNQHLKFKCLIESCRWNLFVFHAKWKTNLWNTEMENSDKSLELPFRMNEWFPSRRFFLNRRRMLAASRKLANIFSTPATKPATTSSSFVFPSSPDPTKFPYGRLQLTIYRKFLENFQFSNINMLDIWHWSNFDLFRSIDVEITALEKKVKWPQTGLKFHFFRNDFVFVQSLSLPSSAMTASAESKMQILDYFSRQTQNSLFNIEIFQSIMEPIWKKTG